MSPEHSRRQGWFGRSGHAIARREMGLVITTLLFLIVLVFFWGQHRHFDPVGRGGRALVAHLGHDNRSPVPRGNAPDLSLERHDDLQRALPARGSKLPRPLTRRAGHHRRGDHPLQADGQTGAEAAPEGRPDLRRHDREPGGEHRGTHRHRPVPTRRTVRGVLRRDPDRHRQPGAPRGAEPVRRYRQGAAARHRAAAHRRQRDSAEARTGTARVGDAVLGSRANARRPTASGSNPRASATISGRCRRRSRRSCCSSRGSRPRWIWRNRRTRRWWSSAAVATVCRSS